jgi:serine/threonine-protein kinase
MSAPNPSALLGFLERNGFLSPTQVRQLAGGGVATASPDPRGLAKMLVERGWLTSYQANLLLQGRGQELVLGPYRLLDRLGEGGMGQVLKARHVSMDRVVALKIIRKDRVSHPVALSRFDREVRAVSKLSHPNVVTAFDVAQVGGTHYLAMEYVEGIDLARLVQQSGRLPIANACEYARQAASGLQHAHERGLVHRDIKPGNMMITRPNPAGPPVVKVLDFGLARFESESDQSVRLTQLGRIVGTVDYIAPEQAQNARTADIRADVYSLGCSLFYLLTGRPPFGGDDTVERVGGRLLGEAPSVRRDRPEVSAALDGVVAKMMARKPEDRYQTPGEVAEALGPHAREGTPAPSDVNPRKGRGGHSSQTVSDDVGSRGAGAAGRPPKQHDHDETLPGDERRSGEGKKRRAARTLPYLIGGGLLLAVLFSVVLVVVLRAKPKVDQPGPEVAAKPVGGKEDVRVREPVTPANKDIPKTDKGRPSGGSQVSPKGEVRYLSDLAEFDVRVAEGRFAKKGKLGYMAGNPPSGRIITNGKESPNGLSMHPESNSYARAKYKLDKSAKTFLASVALNDSAGAPGKPPGVGKIPTPLVWKVVGDGEVLWESKPIDAARQVQQCEVAVAGVEVLELRVECGGSAVNAQPVWIEPRVVLR